MIKINMLEAKTNLSKYISILESKQENEIIIARNGNPIAKLTLVAVEPQRRIGVAKEYYEQLKDFNTNDFDDEILEMFGLKDD